MVDGTHKMQENFTKQGGEALVVPVDWACSDKFRPDKAYYEDQESAEFAGRAFGNFLRGVKQSGIIKNTLNVVAHSMGNRVLRCVGKSAVSHDSSWYTDALQDGVSLLEAAPEDLKRHEDLFDNLFFVAADIPESVFEKPDGKENSEQQEHALRSGVAALAVMTKRMHVLHALNDIALGGSKVMNKDEDEWFWNKDGWSIRLGSVGPKYRQGKAAEVWEKIGNTLEKNTATDGSVDNNNVHVLDCTDWNNDAIFNNGGVRGSALGHSYQAFPESVAYYLKHMPKRRM